MSIVKALPAGTYWIGDPGYVFPNEGPMKDKWSDLLSDQSCNFFEEGFGEIDDGKIRVWADSTAYGDGEYCGFPVDSGLLGIMPIETVDYLGVPKDSLIGLGQQFSWDEPFIIEFRHGVFRFGFTLLIDTHYDGWENDEDYEDNYDPYEDN